MFAQRSLQPPERASNADGSDAAAVLDSGEAGGLAIRGAGLRGIGFVFATLLGAASAPLLIRHLGIIEFGRYTTVVSLVALVNGVTEGGISAVGTREYAQLAGSERDRLMRNLLGMRLVMITFGCLGAIAFAWLAGYGTRLVIGTAVASVGLFFTVLQTTYSIPLYATLVIGRQVVAETGRQLLFVALVAALVVAGAGVVWFLAASIPPAIALLLYTVYLVRGRMPLRPAFEISRWRRITRDTLPLALGSAVNTVYFRSVIIVMSLIATAHQVGLFAASYRVMEFLIGLPVLLVGTAFPVLARAASTDEKRLTYGAERLLDSGVLAGVGLVCVTVLGARPALLLIGGVATHGAVPVLQIQSIALFHAFLNTTFGLTLLAQRRNREVVGSSLTALLVVLIATFALVPALEARGAAIASVVAETVLSLLLIVFIRRDLPDLRYHGRNLPKVAAACLVGLALGALIPMPQIVRPVVFALAYVSILGLLGAIPGELQLALGRGLARLRHP